jgi:hypothetical protein
VSDLRFGDDPTTIRRVHPRRDPRRRGLRSIYERLGAERKQDRSLVIAACYLTAGGGVLAIALLV